MNIIEMKTAIHQRLHEIDKRNAVSKSEANRNAICCAAVAATGIGCLGIAAAMPLAAVHTLPIFASAGLAGSLGLAAGIKIGGMGLTLMGTGIGILPIVSAAALAVGLGSLAGGSVLGWELAHRTANLLALGLHWTGSGLVAMGIAWAAYLCWKSVLQPMFFPTHICTVQ